MLTRCIPGFLCLFLFALLVITGHPVWAAWPAMLMVPLLGIPVVAWCFRS